MPASHSSCTEHAFSKLCWCNVGAVMIVYLPGQLCIIDFIRTMIASLICVHCVTQGLPAYCRYQVMCPLKCRYHGNSCEKPASMELELTRLQALKVTHQELDTYGDHILAMLCRVVAKSTHRLAMLQVPYTRIDSNSLCRAAIHSAHPVRTMKVSMEGSAKCSAALNQGFSLKAWYTAVLSWWL